MLPPPQRPTGRRLPNASPIRLVGGTVGGSVELSVIPLFYADDDDDDVDYEDSLIVDDSDYDYDDDDSYNYNDYVVVVVVVVRIQ